MGNIAPAPLAAPKQPQGVEKKRTKKATESHRLWSTLVEQYDQLWAMKGAYDNIPQKELTEEQAELKEALAKHFEAPALYTALELLASERPKKEVPKYFAQLRERMVRCKDE